MQMQMQTQTQVQEQEQVQEHKVVSRVGRDRDGWVLPECELLINGWSVVVGGDRWWVELKRVGLLGGRERVGGRVGRRRKNRRRRKDGKLALVD